MADTQPKTAQEAVSAVVTEVVVAQVTGQKKWYESRTIWANLIMALAYAAQAKYGFIVGPELQALGISAVNVWLRKITKDEIVW